MITAQFWTFLGHVSASRVLSSVWRVPQTVYADLVHPVRIMKSGSRSTRLFPERSDMKPWWTRRWTWGPCPTAHLIVSSNSRRSDIRLCTRQAISKAISQGDRSFHMRVGEGVPVLSSAGNVSGDKPAFSRFTLCLVITSWILTVIWSRNYSAFNVREERIFSQPECSILLARNIWRNTSFTSSSP